MGDHHNPSCNCAATLYLYITFRKGTSNDDKEKKEICQFTTQRFPSCYGTIVNLKDCNKNIENHLANIHQSQSGISSERSLILSRIGVFGASQNTTRKKLICENHRDKLGIKFKARAACQHPNHNSKQAPDKGRTLPLVMSKDIYNVTSNVVPVGEGQYLYRLSI